MHDDSNQVKETFNQIFSKDFNLEESKHRGPFDFVSRDSKNLFVTIGDSWTYGWRLSDEVDTDKDFYRVDHCYGGIISKMLGWDFLNLSIPAVSNLWMAKKYQEICENARLLKYNRIKVFITLTEYGREFWTDVDNSEPEIFQKYKNCQTVVDISCAISNHVSEMLSITNDVVELDIGINYVSNLYPSKLEILPQSWLEVLKNQPIDEFCAVVGSWVIPKYKNLVEVNPTVNRLQLANDIEQMIDESNHRLDIIYNTGFNHKVGYGHPNSQGHALWAKYIMNNIKV